MSVQKHPNAPVSEAAASPAAPGIPNRPFPLKRIIAVLLLVAGAFAAAALLLPRPAHAKDAVGLEPAQKKQVERLQDYLNAIATMSSRFMQTTSQGQFAQGDFKMARPGRMRIDYDPPMPVRIVSDGLLVMYKDTELDQLSFMPLSQMPASMFIGDKVDFFSDELLITDYEAEANAIRVTLQRADDPMEGSLTLVFEDKPLQLRKWSVVDAQGVTTTVALMGARFGVDLPDELFKVESRTLDRRGQ